MVDISNTISSQVSSSMDDLTMKNALNGVNGGKKNDPKRIEKATKDFESYFLSYMIKEMRKTIPEGGLFQKGDGEKIFEEMLDQRYAGLMADRGGLGLSRIMMERYQKNVTSPADTSRSAGSQA